MHLMGMAAAPAHARNTCVLWAMGKERWRGLPVAIRLEKKTFSFRNFGLDGVV